MTTKKKASKKAFDAPRGNTFNFDPYDLIIIGVDTNDGPEHHLYDKRNKIALSETFVANVETYGIIMPVVITKVAGQAVVVAGRRRVRAARIIWDKQKAAGESSRIVVPCVVRGGSDLRLMGAMKAENAARLDDDIFSKIDSMQSMRDRGAGDDDLAITFDVSAKTIANWTKLSEAAKAVKAAVSSGKISPSSAIQIASLEGEEAQTKALEEAIAAGGTVVEARRAVSKTVRENGGNAAKGDGVGVVGRKVQRKLLDYASGTENNDKEEFWDGVAECLKAILGEKVTDPRMKRALKELG